MAEMEELDTLDVLDASPDDLARFLTGNTTMTDLSLVAQSSQERDFLRDSIATLTDALSKSQENEEILREELDILRKQFADENTLLTEQIEDYTQRITNLEAELHSAKQFGRRSRRGSSLGGSFDDGDIDWPPSSTEHTRMKSDVTTSTGGGRLIHLSRQWNVRQIDKFEELMRDIEEKNATIESLIMDLDETTSSLQTSQQKNIELNEMNRTLQSQIMQQSVWISQTGNSVSNLQQKCDEYEKEIEQFNKLLNRERRMSTMLRLHLEHSSGGGPSSSSSSAKAGPSVARSGSIISTGTLKFESHTLDEIHNRERTDSIGTEVSALSAFSAFSTGMEQSDPLSRHSTGFSGSRPPTLSRIISGTSFDDTPSPAVGPTTAASRPVTTTAATFNSGMNAIDARDVMKEYIHLTATAVRLMNPLGCELITAEEMIAESKGIPFYQLNEFMVDLIKEKMRLKQAMPKLKSSQSAVIPGQSSGIVSGASGGGKRRLKSKRKRAAKTDSHPMPGLSKSVTPSVLPSVTTHKSQPSKRMTDDTAGITTTATVTVSADTEGRGGRGGEVLSSGRDSRKGSTFFGFKSRRRRKMKKKLTKESLDQTHKESTDSGSIRRPPLPKMTAPKRPTGYHHSTSSAVARMMASSGMRSRKVSNASSIASGRTAGFDLYRRSSRAREKAELVRRQSQDDESVYSMGTVVARHGSSRGDSLQVSSGSDSGDGRALSMSPQPRWSDSRRMSDSTERRTSLFKDLDLDRRESTDDGGEMSDDFSDGGGSTALMGLDVNDILNDIDEERQRQRRLEVYLAQGRTELALGSVRRTPAVSSHSSPYFRQKSFD